MDTIQDQVFFKKGLASGYDAILSKDANTLYFTTDTNEIFLGNARYGFKGISVKLVDSTGNEIAEENLGNYGVVVGIALNGDTLEVTLGTGVNATVTSEVLNQIAAAFSGNEFTVTDTENGKLVSLKIAEGENAGNVALEVTENGLKANVEIPEDQVLGVKEGDNVLKLGEGKLLETVIGLTYDSAAKEIRLTGLNNEVIATVDATDFIKDGMVDTVTYDPATKKATITFNTEAGKEAIEVDLGTLVDTYTAGAGLKVENNEFAIDNTVESTAEAADETLTPDFGGSVDIKTAKYNAQGLVVGQKNTKITLPTLPKTTVVDTNSTDDQLPTAKAVETRVAAAEKKAADALTTARGEITKEIATAKSEAITAATPVWGTF